jgi:hypothetical protein
MPQADFDEIWVPRIGERATGRLRADTTALLVILPLLLIVGIVASALDGPTSTFTFVFWIVAAVAALLIFIVWLRSRIALARELSQWFGARVSWTQLPRMQPASFDAWSERRGLEPPTDRPAPRPAGVFFHPVVQEPRAAALPDTEER